MHTTICRMLLTLQSSTLVLPSSWTLRVRIPAVSALKGSFLPPLHVRAHLCDSFLCPRGAGCCWLTWWYRQRGRERMGNFSSSKLSSSSTRALNPVFIYCHLTSLLAWPCVHKVIPVRGFLLRRERSRGAEKLQPVLLWECVCSQCWGKSLLCHRAGVMCLGKFLLAYVPVSQNCWEIFCFPPVSLRFTWTDISLNSSLQILTQHWSCQLTVILSTHTQPEKLFGCAEAVAESGTWL